MLIHKKEEPPLPSPHADTLSTNDNGALTCKRIISPNVAEASSFGIKQHPDAHRGAIYLLFAVWYLILAAFIFEEFLGWFFNVNIITDERIVEVDFHNLIYRRQHIPLFQLITTD